MRGILARSFTFPLARASAALINLNTSLILLTVCHGWIGRFQQFPRGLVRVVHLRRSIVMHQILGISILLFALVHVTCHVVNFCLLHRHSEGLLNFWRVFLTHPTSVTGHLLVILLICIYAGYWMKRRLHYEIFWMGHLVGALLYIVILSLHGTFCFIKSDHRPYCLKPQSWIWMAPSVILYLLDWFYQEVILLCSAATVEQVILHQSGVFELVFRKDGWSFVAGQYVELMVPSVSAIQWHPFTLTSAPEEPLKSIHIRVVGEWTRKVARAHGIIFEKETNRLIEVDLPQSLPAIWIRGPFGCSLNGYLDYDVTVLVGAGIGQTPMASILKHIWLVRTTNLPIHLQHVIFYGICRDSQVQSRRFILSYPLHIVVFRMVS